MWAKLRGSVETRKVRRSVTALVLLLAGCGLPADAPAWEQLPAPDAPERWGHAAAIDTSRDRMLVFGGEQRRGQLDDVWAMDLATNTWTRVETTDGPGPRSDLANVLDAVRDRWIVIGGRVGLADSIAEVWSLDLSTSAWTQLPDGPPARHDIPGATDGARAWVYGGAGVLFESLDDLWELDLASGEWRELPKGDSHPIARTSCALAYWDGALYMHGGHDVAQVFRDTWRYDLARERWERLDVDGSAAANAHFGFATDAECGRILLSGGDNLDNFVVSLSDALVLGDQPRFERLPASVLPLPRDHATLVVDAPRRRMILYGGGALGDGLETFGDAWAYPLGACP